MTPQQLSDAIGAIYDCALEPERWPNALQQVSALSGAGFNFVIAHDIEKNQAGRIFQHGGTTDWILQYCVKYAPINPLTTASWLRPIGEVYNRASLVSNDEWFEGRFFNEYIRPSGITDIMGLMGLRSRSRAVWLVAARLNDEPPEFSARDMNMFQLLSPHVCRTIKISHALNLRTLRSEALEAALDALSAGVFLLDREARVVHANHAGERQVKTGNAVRIANDRFYPINPLANETFTAALAGGTANDNPTIANMHSIAMLAHDGEGLIATVLPINEGPREDLLGPWSARWAVFVQNPSAAPQIPGEAFAKLYGLTGGELRVVLALGPGLNAKEAADVLGISEATVRTHLQHVFEKTGTTRQSELIKLMMASTPPISAAEPPAGKSNYGST